MATEAKADTTSDSAKATPFDPDDLQEPAIARNKKVASDEELRKQRLQHYQNCIEQFKDKSIDRLNACITDEADDEEDDDGDDEEDDDLDEDVYWMPEHERDANGKVKPKLYMCHAHPIFCSQEIEAIDEDDGEIYNIKVTLNKSSTATIKTPTIQYSEPVKKPSRVPLPIQEITDYLDQWKFFSTHVHRRVALINLVRKKMYDDAENRIPDAKSTSVSAQIKPGNDKFGIVIESDEKDKKDKKGDADPYPNKRRRLLRNFEDTSTIDRLQEQLSKGRTRMQMIRDEHSRAMESQQQTMAREVEAARSDHNAETFELRKKLSSENAELITKSEKSEKEKKLLHDKLNGLLTALGEVKEAVHTVKPET